MKIVFILLILVSCSSAVVEDNKDNKVFTKYEVGDTVMINLKGVVVEGDDMNGRCYPVGEIAYIDHQGYHVKNIWCNDGRHDDMVSREDEILDVFYQEDFERGERYGPRSWWKLPLFFLFHDKTKDFLPCMRNNLEDDEKEKLCEENEWKFK